MNINKVILIGRLGKEPHIIACSNGSRMAMLSVATSESWKDKVTGEKKQATEWHNVVVTNQGLVDIADKYLKKGLLVYIEGTLKSREVEKQGTKSIQTEVVVNPYSGELQILEKQQ